MTDAARRKLVAQELIDTEGLYVNYLKNIKKIQDELSKAALIPENEIKQIFSIISNILSLNEELLRALEAQRDKIAADNLSGLVDIFCGMSPFLKMYSAYVNNYETSLATYAACLHTNKKFVAFIEGKNEDLSDLLIMPVQRLPRYELFLHEIIKCTSPSESIYAGLSNALVMMKNVNTTVNDIKRSAENFQQVFKIQNQFPTMDFNLVEPHRVYIGDIALMLKKDTTSMFDSRLKPVHLFLFNDLILLGYIGHSVDLRYGIQYLSFDSIGLKNATVKDATAEGTFEIAVGKDKVMLQASSTAQKLEWLKRIGNAITACKNTNTNNPLAIEFKRMSYTTGSGRWLLLLAILLVLLMVLQYVGGAVLGVYVWDSYVKPYFGGAGDSGHKH